MNVAFLGNAGVDLLEEIQKLSGPALVAFSDHEARGDVESREQRRCAVTDIIVDPALANAEPSSARLAARHPAPGWAARRAGARRSRRLARAGRVSDVSVGLSAPPVARSAGPAWRSLSAPRDAGGPRSADSRSGHRPWPARRCRRSGPPRHRGCGRACDLVHAGPATSGA